MKPVPTEARCGGRRIVFFETCYTLWPDRLLDDRGGVPATAVADLIGRYLAKPPVTGASLEDDWCSFRELRGAGPLAVNFAANTHKTIAATFASNLSALDRAAGRAAGVLQSEPGFDRRYCFQALPEMPLVLNYNAADDLFPAQAHLLFRRCAQAGLDIRDHFMLGTYLTGRLVGAYRPQ